MTGATELESLLQQKTWDKEIVLWLGSEPALKSLLAKHNNTLELDLLEFFDPNDLPADDEETRTQLSSALRQRLQALNGTGRSPILLVVRSCGLLARYQLGLRMFYDWFCGDFSMAIIPLAHSSEDTAWPATVVFERDRLYNYFAGPGMCSRIVTDKG